MIDENLNKKIWNFFNQPKIIHPSAFIADGAKLIGDITIGQNSSIWYNCVLRADVEKIVIGENTNIQDGSVLHVDFDCPCIIENNVTVGHNVTLHGCKIEEGCLIGMGAVVLSGAFIGKGSLIAAGSVVKENEIIKPFSLFAGVPAKKIRKDLKLLHNNLMHAAQYVEFAKLHKNNQ